ncbi:MAG: DMT family transporter [Thermoplasmataceae archaeon]|jgi:drug/metabolite transporter (DMT)-like permease
MEKRLFYMGMLLLVTFFWGVTFPVVKFALQFSSPDTFLALRFLIASAVMGLFLRRGRKNLNRNTVLHGIIAGFLLFLGYYFQTVGLDYTSAAASGVITGVYVIILPVLSYVYLSSRISRVDILASLIAFSGLILMSISSGTHGTTLLGNLLTLICGIAYAFQIIYVSKHSSKLDSSAFTFYQLAFVTVFSALTIPISPGGIGTVNTDVVLAALFTALVGSVFGYYVSTVALIYVDASAAGIIFVGEPIFAALSSVVLAHEVLSRVVIAGAILMVIAMFLTTVDKYLREHKRRGKSAL